MSEAIYSDAFFDQYHDKRIDVVPYASDLCTYGAVVNIDDSTETFVCRPSEHSVSLALGTDFKDRCRLKCLEALGLTPVNSLGECPNVPSSSLHRIFQPEE